MAYLLDTNVFIEPHRSGFDFGVCPGYWDWLDQANAEGKLASIDRVLDELRARDDDLREWAEERAATLFLPVDASTLTAVGRLMTWATGAGFTPAALATFASEADVFLVAFASAHRHVVVTRETPAQHSKPSRIKIPNACAELRVDCINTLAMLRRERVRLVLGQSSR